MCFSMFRWKVTWKKTEQSIVTNIEWFFLQSIQSWYTVQNVKFSLLITWNWFTYVIITSSFNNIHHIRKMIPTFYLTPLTETCNLEKSKQQNSEKTCLQVFDNSVYQKPILNFKLPVNWHHVSEHKQVCNSKINYKQVYRY